MITRSEGIAVPGWFGPRPGGGMTGLTKELDAAVERAAELLAAEFPGEAIEIRFNSDRESGGAFLKDESRGPLGISAELRPDPSVFKLAYPDFVGDEAAFLDARAAYWKAWSEAPKVVAFHVLAGMNRLGDESLATEGAFPDFYAHPDFDSASDALAWIRRSCVVRSPRVTAGEMARWRKRRIEFGPSARRSVIMFDEAVRQTGVMGMHGGRTEADLASILEADKGMSRKDARNVAKAVFRLLPKKR